MSDRIWAQPEIIQWSQILLNSYEKLLGRKLIQRKTDLEERAKDLFFAPFVVVSHGTQSDPIYNYANQIALKLWEMSWQDFTQMPSRLSAEPIERESRDKLLDTVAKQGYIDNYAGVRISKTGKRFLIDRAIVWNLTDAEEKFCGQAATFPQWSFLL